MGQDGPRRSPRLLNLTKVAASIPATRPAMQAKMRALSRSPRRASTKDWSGAAPTRGKERKELLHECGSHCFLLPGKLKFPICPALRVTDGHCRASCEGVAAAKVRARQYNYTSVADKAEKVHKALNCPQTKKTSSQRK